MNKDIKIINDECTASWYLGRIGKEASLYICTYCYEYTPVVNDSLYMPSKNVYNLFPICPRCGMIMHENKEVEIDKDYSFKSMSLNRKSAHR